MGRVGERSVKFSQVFGLGQEQPQLDFVDITPGRDTPLFLDPFAISLRRDAWSDLCDRHITHFFQTALDHIRANRDAEARRMLNGLSEPNETCLGLSTGQPAGRGVAGKQALDLYGSLLASQAAQSGLLTDLAECDLFVPGIGSDKISDITTNIIRRPLIEYTQAQCELHSIPLDGEYPSGRFWDMEAAEWRQEYARLPVVGQKRILLVPKFSVRRRMCLDAQEYYSHHILNFIAEEELARGSSLVRTLKNGEPRKPTKKTLKERFPFSKRFLEEFSQAHPEVLARAKMFYAEVAKGPLRHEDFNDEFDEAAFARALAGVLPTIPSGNADAGRYHTFVVGALEFVFWPSLIYPQKEEPLHEGRKRIDITYTNTGEGAFFNRVRTAPDTAARYIVTECKNYSKDPANPEIDQLSGRFSPLRGRLGLLLYRSVSDYDLLCQRCRDTARDNRGVMLPIGDEQLLRCLECIAQGRRGMIEGFLEGLLRRVVS